MSEVKRYTIVECHNDEEFWAKMKEVNNGEYVTYNDYAEIKKLLDENFIERSKNLTSENMKIKYQNDIMLGVLNDVCEDYYISEPINIRYIESVIKKVKELRNERYTGNYIYTN